MAIASSVYRTEDAPTAPPLSTSPTSLAPGAGEKLVSAAGNTGKPLTRPEWHVVFFMAFVALATYLIVLRFDDQGPEETWFKPAAGVTVFAVFYVLAQTIERLLLPIARLVPTTAVKTPEGGGTSAPASEPPATESTTPTPLLGYRSRLVTRHQAFKQRTAAVERCANIEDPDMSGDPDMSESTSRALAKREAQAAANWQEALQQAQVNSTTVWAIGAALAFILCAALDVYLLSAIGVIEWNPPHWLDLLATGMAIGGGTAPLHDLIDRVQKKDDSQASTTATSATPGGGLAGVAMTPRR